MAVVGYLGSADDGVVFQVSREAVRTVHNMAWGGSARFAVHQRHLGNAITEFAGLDPDTITFDVTFLAELGVEPIEEIEKLFRYEREGRSLQLVLGEHVYGKYRWTIVSHKTKAEYFDKNGDIFCATVSLSLQEYLLE